MTTLVDRSVLDLPVVSDAAMRRSLREQIARLESESVALEADPARRPRRGSPRRRGSADPARPGRRTHPGAAFLSTAELERIRNQLAHGIRARRFSGGEEQERKRRLREEMLLDPRAHVGVTISNADVGEPGCTRWSSWFRLRVSGGCP
jgi:hypothetical protein